MNGQTYVTAFTNRYGVGPEGQINDFISRRGDRLLLADQIDLNAMVARYGAPLEVVYCPQITVQIERMREWAETARARSGYAGGFIYAYATKANFAEEVVRTALNSGAHYENVCGSGCRYCALSLAAGHPVAGAVHFLQWLEG
ncbi:MAG: hypothetical protein RMJ48_20510 [Roseiflexaceae bacterium]|nr:hypothetical protein [Roseiflexaceae bacterium]